MNYYEHHIGDYAEATAHLSFVEDAAYSRMIRKYYSLEGPLPADMRAVQRLICARTEEERAAVETVLSEFFTLESDGWHQSRCDAEVERFRAKSDKARNSASKRWNATDSTSSNANASKNDANASKTDASALPTQSEGNAKAMPHAGAGAHVPQSPDTSNQTKEEKTFPGSPPKAVSASKRGARLPENFVLPKAWGDWAVGEGLPVDVVRFEAQQFRDYWVAKPGKDAVKLDWQATWRTWARKRIASGGGKPANGYHGNQSPLLGGSVLTDEERANTRAAMEQFQ